MKFLPRNVLISIYQVIMIDSDWSMQHCTLFWLVNWFLYSHLIGCQSWVPTRQVIHIMASTCCWEGGEVMWRPSTGTANSWSVRSMWWSQVMLTSDWLTQTNTNLWLVSSWCPVDQWQSVWSCSEEVDLCLWYSGYRDPLSEEDGSCCQAGVPASPLSSRWRQWKR